LPANALTFHKLRPNADHWTMRSTSLVGELHLSSCLLAL